MAHPVVKERKKERKKFIKGHWANGDIRWFGGILFFIDNNGTPYNEVAGAKEIPKPGKETRGTAGAFPAPTERFRSIPARKNNSVSQRSTSSSQKIYHYRLPMALDVDGECCECNYFPNDEKMLRTEDEGFTLLVKCQSCGTVMLPKKRRSGGMS